MGRLSLALILSIQWKKKSSKAIMRRGRRRQRRDVLVAPEIPLDLQIEIMTRLPAKSLMRFKCVSKLWSSLIRSRFFSNRYLTVASTRPRPPRLYMSLVDHKCGSRTMEMICHNPRESILVSLSSSSSNSGKSFDQDLTIPGVGGHHMVVFRGLILYIVCGKACIYNPSTRQSVTLPAIKSNIFAQEEKEKDKSLLYFLGHDPVLDQYKVVCTLVLSSKDLDRITSEHWVFNLKVGGSWKRIEFDQPHNSISPVLCINGVIYYVAFTSMFSAIVVSFDVRSEEFNIIQPPAVASTYDNVGFIEYGGKPAIIDHTNLRHGGLVDLWVLEDAEKWSMKSLVLQPCQMHLLDNNDDDLTVEGTTQNGEVILAPCELRSPFYILYYDLHKNDLRKVQIRGIPDHRFSSSYFCLTLMDKKSESIIHLEI